MSPRVAPGVMRSAELLRRAPFVFPFEERVRVCLPQSLPSSPPLSLWSFHKPSLHISVGVGFSYYMMVFALTC